MSQGSSPAQHLSRGLDIAQGSQGSTGIGSLPSRLVVDRIQFLVSCGQKLFSDRHLKYTSGLPSGKQERVYQ